MEFPEKDSAALPLGDVRRQSRRAQMSMRPLRTSYGRADGVVLEPVTVYSNSTEMLRAEQILPLNSAVRLESTETDGSVVWNGLNFSLENCVVLRRNDDQGLESAWLGTLDAESKKSIQWTTSSLDLALESWNESLSTRAGQPDSGELQEMQGLWVGGLLDRIARKYPLLPGASVLIGVTREQLGDLKISPQQDQYDRSCIVVVHLSEAALSPIRPDLSIISRGEAGETEEAEKSDQADQVGETQNDSPE